ncbi:MAG: hypothetical protein K0R62_3792 [Nonomuraea muscovyensis]|nr:hypothetical protein [Nonomuraea muscovyensis]
MNAPMDEQRLVEILARAEAAAPGPWGSDGADIYGSLAGVLMIDLWIGETLNMDDLPQAIANASFIAAARSDVPELVAEVQRLLAERHSTNEWVTDAAVQLRVQRDRIAELEAWTPAVQEPENPFRPCGCPKRFDRHAWGCPTVPEDQYASPLHHDYAVPRDLPTVPRQTTGRCPNGHTFEDCTCGGAA